MNQSEEERIITNPVKAIRANCMECCCGSFKEVELCPVQTCPLYPFRFGSNPYRQKRELTDEQKFQLAENGRKALAARRAKNVISDQ